MLKKNQLPSMASKRSHHLIKLLMLIGISIQQSISLQRYHRLTMQLILWLINTLSYWKMVRRICQITVTLDFIFPLVHCSSEDVLFNSICLNVLEGIKQFYLLMWYKKTQLETPFKGDHVKALVKNVKELLAIRRIFSLVDMITNTKFSNCPNVFKNCVVWK